MVLFSLLDGKWRCHPSFSAITGQLRWLAALDRCICASRLRRPASPATFFRQIRKIWYDTCVTRSFGHFDLVGHFNPKCATPSLPAVFGHFDHHVGHFRRGGLVRGCDVLLLSYCAIMCTHLYIYIYVRTVAFMLKRYGSRAPVYGNIAPIYA